jgi:hypothetical protein
MKIMAIVESPWVGALGQHARGEPSRSAFGAAMFYMLEVKPENLIGDSRL